MRTESVPVLFVCSVFVSSFSFIPLLFEKYKCCGLLSGFKEINVENFALFGCNPNKYLYRKSERNAYLKMYFIIINFFATGLPTLDIYTVCI